MYFRKPRRQWSWLLLLVFLLSGATWAQERPRIGLVLSGGGARGAAHIGVLKVLEELRIPIHAIAATSMGAIVGGTYAAGMSINDMEQFITSIDWRDLFRDNPGRQYETNRRKLDQRENLSVTIGLRGSDVLLPKGVISGQKLNLMLRRLAYGAQKTTDFDRLAVPFRAVATDLATGEMVVFDSGRLQDAMRASMSIPGVIEPLDLNDRLLVDGGLVRNLPIDVVRQLGVDVVIAVNLGTPPLRRDQLNTVINVTVQMISILTEQNVRASLATVGKRDVLILPELGDISSADFTRAAEAIAIGEKATRAKADELRRFSLSKAAYQRWRQRFEAFDRTPQPFRVDQVKVDDLQWVNPETVASVINTQAGDVISEQDLREDLNKVYGLGDFERVNYRLMPQQDEQVLTIDAIEKSWGPNYLRFGLRLDWDIRDDARFGLLASYLRTWMNPSGGEWQTDLQIGSLSALRSEFYQPFSALSPWFFAPYISAISRPDDIYDGNDRVAVYRVRTVDIGADLGLNLRERGEARLGVLFGYVDASRDTGDPDLPDFNDPRAGVRARYFYDQLDNLNFPAKGSAVDAEFFYSSEAMGAETDYGQFELRALTAFSMDKHRWSLGLRLGVPVDGEIPPYDAFSLGGFQQLSGLHLGQLRGQYLGLGRLAYYRKIATVGGAIGGDIYAGGSFELGNTWQDKDDISFKSLTAAGSAFVGGGTPLGPLYLAFGMAEGGNNTLYLFLGRP